mgnify:CR=1 FL=1
MAMLELLVAILILSFGIIPLYYMFTSSKTTAFKSEMSYVALNAARERLDELRLLPVEFLLSMAAGSRESRWVPVEGNAFDLMFRASSQREDRAPMDSEGSSALPDPRMGGERFEYPDYYERISLKTELEQVIPLAAASTGAVDINAGPPYLFKATVHVRWQEKGESIGDQTDEDSEHYRAKRFVSKLESLISKGGFDEGWER